MKKRVVLYIRVSTEEQALHGDSLDAQETALVEYAKKHGYIIVKIYRDEGYSARKSALTRKAMQELLSDAQNDQFDLILFTKLDRWFRNVKEYHKVQEILDRNRVDWKTILEDYDTTTSDGRLKINIMLSVAENESDRTSERIKFVNANKIKKKEPITGIQPMGYKTGVVDGNKRVIKDPETQEMVEKIFDHFLTYKSVRLTRLFMIENFGIRRNMSNLTDMFRNEKFTGTYKGVEDYCPAYITPEQHRECVRIIDSKMSGRNPYPDDIQKSYLFRGLIKCPSCGRNMTVKLRTPSGRNSNYYVSYKCWRYNNKQCDNNKTVSQAIIERWLLDNIEDKLKEYALKIQVEESTPKKRPDDQIKKLKDRLTRVNDSYELGNIEREEYVEKTKSIKAQIDDLSVENVVDDRKSIDALKSVISRDFRSNYNLLSSDNKRALWLSLIKEIHVEGNRPVDLIFL